MDLRRPDRRTPMKVRVDKTYQFVCDIWSLYIQNNMQTLK